MSEYKHFNHASILPPVDCPLVIKTDEGILEARRTSFISRKDLAMEYRLESGGVLEGRFDWTYP